MHKNDEQGSKRHTTVITSDEPIAVHVSDAGGYWFRLFRAVVRSGAWSKLTPGAAKVLVVLAESVNDGQRQDRGEWLAWPSIRRIMATAGTSRTTTFAAIAELERAGLLKRRSPGGGVRSTTYQLMDPPVRIVGPVRPVGPPPSEQSDPPPSE